MARKLSPVARRTQRNRTRLKKFAGEGRLRLSVSRSSKNISAQLIDDSKGVTVAAASSLEKAITAKGSNKEGAAAVGKLLAERALAAGQKERCVRSRPFHFPWPGESPGRRRPRGRARILRKIR
ncbi:MAG: 50S ribosomal protein L18 [Terricaulis sp.]|nr:50S ribosomal protein L18 [Terricaulis sp.]